LRPLYTGWFSDFAGLEASAADGPVGYGDSPADRFAGSTYDPTSHYRARAVIRFFESEGLGLDCLRRRSLEQTGRLFELLEGYEVATPREAEGRGGFVSVRLERATEVVRELRSRGVYVDSRGTLLRFGPAPYTTEDELERAVAALRAIAPLG
jgi:kynureninase